MTHRPSWHGNPRDLHHPRTTTIVRPARRSNGLPREPAFLPCSPRPLVRAAGKGQGRNVRHTPAQQSALLLTVGLMSGTTGPADQSRPDPICARLPVCTFEARNSSSHWGLGLTDSLETTDSSKSSGVRGIRSFESTSQPASQRARDRAQPNTP
ncbi:hypothetical protein GGR56DRAFT_661191 [Xylariaceae sp. FL0804]|nr:hypothetical protein GGR56DRAFT_661191 [Xylariaceae sp. FL0804]